MRFHSLPESKRYAEDESEYAVVLERYNTVLDELFAGEDVYVVTPVWATDAEVPPLQPDVGYWQSLLVEDDPDPGFRTYCHLFAVRRPWRSGCLDELLREIADNKVAGVLVTDTQMRRIHHPYDGGADVFLTTHGERDRTRDRHADWLSARPPRRPLPHRRHRVLGPPPLPLPFLLPVSHHVHSGRQGTGLWPVGHVKGVARSGRRA
ncbi:hypothetical protein OG259_40655 [Streptomyces sp. NBC_00250]|uniref:DUF3885 domain-containing protein n=1 Tax=Streptomyces sp. NBC_00250 TaxID=2903641 RepID=UPI002E2879D3|nr:hypothetical protein [Streptomyces sp. NBC_00250]